MDIPISIRKVLVNSSSKNLLDNISLDIYRGDIFYLVGPNGAGKTTLIKTILGLISPDDGEILIEGEEIDKDNRNHLMQNIGVLIEQAAFYGHLSVFDNLKIISKYYNIDSSKIQEVAGKVGLVDDLTKRASKLSMGMKQRLGLAMSIIHEPSIIILDEPTNGLDPAGVIEFRNLIQKLNKEFDCTFLITTHILSEVEKMAGRVALIREGKIIDCFLLSETLNSYHGMIIHLKDEDFTNQLESILNTHNILSLYYKDGLDTILLLNKEIDTTFIEEEFKLKGYLNIDMQKLSTITVENYYLAKTAQHARLSNI